MRKLSLLPLLFFAALVFPFRVHATNVTLNAILPSTTVRTEQEVTLNATCDDVGKKMAMWWKREDKKTWTQDASIVTITSTNKTWEWKVTFEPGIYAVRAECNGVSSVDKTLTVQKFNSQNTPRSLTFSSNPITAGLKGVTATIKGCALIAPVKLNIQGASPLSTGEYTGTTDGQGTYSLPNLDIHKEVGTYTATVDCDGVKTVSSYDVTATSQSALKFYTSPPQLIANTTASKLVAEGCPTNTSVAFEWNLVTDPTDFSYNSKGSATSGTNNIAAYSQPQGFNFGKYRAKITCGPTVVDGLSFEVIKDTTPITFDYSPKPLLANDSASTLTVRGCPDGPVTLEWNIQGSARQRNDAANLTSASRLTTHKQGFNPGEYGVRISCGGNVVDTDTNKDMYSFTVSNDRPTPTITPTPPTPPCNATLSTDDASCIEVNTALGDIQTDPILFIKRMFGLFLSVSGGVGVVMVMYSGYKYILSRGDPDKTKQARELLTSTILGFLFLIFSMVILQIIGVDILRIPGFGV